MTKENKNHWWRYQFTLGGLVLIMFIGGCGAVALHSAIQGKSQLNNIIIALFSLLGITIIAFFEWKSKDGVTHEK